MLANVLVIYIVTVCSSPRLSTVACTICMVFNQFCQVPLMYEADEEGNTWVQERVRAAILVNIECFTLLALLSMTITYSMQNTDKLRQYKFENLGLLDDLEEGVIVVSETDLRLCFASQPAIRLLEQTKSSE